MNRLKRNPVIVIPLLYALFGALWILVTDFLVIMVTDDPRQFLQWQTFKGWLFVAASTALIYNLLARTVARWRQARQELIRQEESYRLLFESSPLPMWVYDLETLAFLAVNDAAIAKYEYTRQEFLAMSLRDIRPQQEIAALLQDVAETEERLNFAGEWRHKRKDGAVFWVEIGIFSIFRGRVNSNAILSLY
jgi:PAS domain S-box-containing protein